MKRKTDRFECADDAGNIIVLIERTAMITTRRLDGPITQTNGAVDYISTAGHWANDLRDGTFKLQDDRLVRRVVPKG